MATPLFSTGFEHQAPFTTNGGGLYSVVLGTWTIDTTIKHTGNAAAKVAVASGAAADIRSSKGISGTAVVQSVYVNFGPSLPGGSVVINILGAANTPASSFPSVGYDPVSGFFTVQQAASARQFDNVTVAANTWYRIDFKAELSGGNQLVDVKIDGRAITQSSLASSSTGYGSLLLGTVRTDHAVNFDIYFDDWCTSATAADYPLSEGKDYGFVGLFPNADGSHSAGVNTMEDQAGNDINGTTVTAYDKLNSAPPDSTVYVKQSTSGANYVEVSFPDISVSHSAIHCAMAFLAYTSSGTAANKGGCIVSKDNFSSYSEVWGNPTTQQDYSDGATNNLFFKSVMVSGVIDDTTVNALKARMGYSSDVSPVPYWIDFVVEVMYFTGEAPISLDLVTYINTYPALTVIENTVIPLDLVTYSNTYPDLTVVENIPVPLDLVTYSRTVYDITTVDNVSTPLDLVTYSGTVYDITTIENTVIPLDLVTYSDTIPTITFTENVVDVLDLVTYSDTVNDLTTVESVGIQLDLVTYSNTVNDITTIENTIIPLDLVVYTQTVPDLTILENVVEPLDLVNYSVSFPSLTVLENETITLDSVVYSSSVNDVYLLEEGEILLDQVTYLNSFPDLTIIEHDVYTLDLVSFQNVIADITLAGNDVTTLDLVSYVSLVNAIAFISSVVELDTPDYRIYGIPFESRVLVIRSDNRDYPINQEYRTFPIK